MCCNWFVAASICKGRWVLFSSRAAGRQPVRDPANQIARLVFAEPQGQGYNKYMEKGTVRQ